MQTGTGGRKKVCAREKNTPSKAGATATGTWIYQLSRVEKLRTPSTGHAWMISTAWAGKSAATPVCPTELQSKYADFQDTDCPALYLRDLQEKKMTSFRVIEHSHEKKQSLSLYSSAIFSDPI